jgi:4-phytase / acid phosphatase
MAAALRGRARDRKADQTAVTVCRCWAELVAQVAWSFPSKYPDALGGSLPSMSCSISTIIRLGLAAFALASGTGAPAAPASNLELVSDRVVILMRHGIRSPTKQPPLPPGATAQAWPDWPVPPGYLTPHGGRAIGRVGSFDRSWLVGQGLIPRSGCPTANSLSIIADSDERTIETARNWAANVAPGCKVPITHKPQGTADPLFHAVEQGQVRIDPKRAAESVRKAFGGAGMAGLDQRFRPVLRRLDRVLCGSQAKGCGISSEPTTLVPATATSKPRLAGALDKASTAGQTVLLEYAGGKAIRNVGWGRASVADVRDLSVFHAFQYGPLQRDHYLASVSLALLLPRIRQALSGASASPGVLMIAGHDGTVANLAGLLDAHWTVPGLAADDPVPGGALVIERLRDAAGSKYFRVYYRGQTLEQMRTLAPLRPQTTYMTRIRLPACNALGMSDLCTESGFAALIGKISK